VSWFAGRDGAAQPLPASRQATGGRSFQGGGEGHLFVRYLTIQAGRVEVAVDVSQDYSLSQIAAAAASVLCLAPCLAA